MGPRTYVNIWTKESSDGFIFRLFCTLFLMALHSFCFFMCLSILLLPFVMYKSHQNKIRMEQEYLFDIGDTVYRRVDDKKMYVEDRYLDSRALSSRSNIYVWCHFYDVSYVDNDNNPVHSESICQKYLLTPEEYLKDDGIRIKIDGDLEFQLSDN